MLAHANDSGGFHISRGGGPQPSHCSGFTLLELLVVIAIIALLLLIFSPSLRSLNPFIAELTCQANLREMSKAMMAYVADNDYYPGHVDRYDGSPTTAVWPTRLREYAGGETKIFYCSLQEEGFKWRKVYGTGYGYAKQSHVDRWGYELGEMLLNVHQVPFSYGYNDWGAHGAFVNSGLGGDLWVMDGPDSYKWDVRSSQVVDPSNMIAISDGIRMNSWDFNIDPGNWREYPSAIHEGGAEFLFADGHSEWISQAQATNVRNHSTDPEAYEMNRRWNNSNEAEDY